MPIIFVLIFFQQFFVTLLEKVKILGFGLAVCHIFYGAIWDFFRVIIDVKTAQLLGNKLEF